jgi:hypothetical protein
MAARVYTQAELALFAQYRDARAAYRPTACIGAEPCWCEQGPPAMRACCQCTGCGECVPGPYRGAGREPNRGIPGRPYARHF